MDSAIGGRVLKFTNLLWHPRKISKPKASKSDTSRPASPPSTSTGRATRPWERNDRNARTRLQGYQRPRLSDTFSSYRPHGSRLVGGSSLHWCRHSRSLARVNGRSSHRPPRHFRSLLTTKQMISACNPLSHYWTETLSKRPYLVAQKWILVGLQILGDLAQSNQFFFIPPPPHHHVHCPLCVGIDPTHNEAHDVAHFRITTPAPGRRRLAATGRVCTVHGTWPHRYTADALRDRPYRHPCRSHLRSSSLERGVPISRPADGQLRFWSPVLSQRCSPGC